MRSWLALLLLAAQPAWASEGAPTGGGSCGPAESCGAPEATRGSSLLQSRQQLGKAAAAGGAPEEPQELAAREEPRELEAPEEPEALSELGRPDEPMPEYRGCAAFEDHLAEALARGQPALSALEANASGGGALFPCPNSCPWCSTSKQDYHVVTKSNIKYGEATNFVTKKTESLFLDTYEVPSSAVKPVLVVIHGGGYSETSVKTGGWAPHVAKLAARYGYLAVSIEYRRYGFCGECWKLNPNPTVQHPTLDAKAAVRWVRRNAPALKADPGRIAAFGCSAGGEIVASLLMFDWGEGSSGNPGYSSEVQAGVALSAAPQSTYAKKTNGAAVPPYVDFHNEVDDLVPYSRAVETKKYLDSIGATNELITVPGKNHCPDIFGPAHLGDLLGFLTKNLRLPGASCPQAPAPTPAPPTPPTPAPTPAPPPPCPSLCLPPSCEKYYGSAGAWESDRCVGYCNSYMGKRWCGAHGQASGSVDCSPCKAAAAPSAPAPSAPAPSAPAPSTPAPSAPAPSAPAPSTPAPSALAPSTPAPSAPAPSAPAPAAKKLFRAVDGGYGRRCQGASAATHAGQQSLYMCRELCKATAGCAGVTFQSSSGRCDVFAAPIQGSQASSGWSCLSYS